MKAQIVLMSCITLLPILNSRTTSWSWTASCVQTNEHGIFRSESNAYTYRENYKPDKRQYLGRK